MNKEEPQSNAAGGASALTAGLGPWNVAMLSKPQLRPYYVCRQVGTSSWEHLYEDDEHGPIARFETMAEAQAAADAANAQGPNEQAHRPGGTASEETNGGCTGSGAADC